MNDKDLIQVLISQLHDAGDEKIRWRKEREQLMNELSLVRSELRESGLGIQTRLDETLRRLDESVRATSDLRGDLRTSNNLVARYVEDNNRLKNESQGDKKTIAELQALVNKFLSQGGESLFEALLHKGKRFGRKSEKSKNLHLKEEKSREQEKSEYDGSAPILEDKEGAIPPPASDLPAASQADTIPINPPLRKVNTRTDFSKKTTRVGNVVRHCCQSDAVPSDARKMDDRTYVTYTLDWKIIKHIFEVLHVVDDRENFYDVYRAQDENDKMLPFTDVVPGCPADASLLAGILVNKYQYHLPVCRQLEMFRDADAIFSKSTVNDWLHKGVDVLQDTEHAFREAVLIPGSYLFCDEVPELVRVFDEQTEKFTYRKKYMWGIKNDAGKLAYYLYDNGSRGRAVLEKFFENFTGAITTDGYAAYKMFDKDPGRGVVRTGCMAHVRRKFKEAVESDHRSMEFIHSINELFWVETECKIFDLPPEAVKERRTLRSGPVLAEMYEKLKRMVEDKVTHYSDLLRKAVTYAFNEWGALTKYLENGIWKIDNNAAERMMRPVALGRKNYMTCGSHRGAEHAAFMYTIVESCKMNGIRPVQYIEDVLRRLSYGETDYGALLPTNWAKKY